MVDIAPVVKQMEITPMLVKVGIAVIGAGFAGYIGGRIFLSVARFLIRQYFIGLEKKIEAAFHRIDEQRKDLRDFKLVEYRDYKRDAALAIKELYDRTDNHEEVRACVIFCNKKNKRGIANVGRTAPDGG
jgi:hypothetical protein